MDLQQNRPRILVTGATGFIGSQVARRLDELGLQPRLMFRRRARADIVSDLDAELVIANLQSEPSLRRAVEGMDAVIHLAGRATFEPYDVVAPTLVDGTRRLANAAAKAGVSTFVFLSSALVYPSVPGEITSDTPVDPQTGYGHAKLGAERILEDISERSGMRTVSLRVPHVYGAGSILFSYADRGMIPFVGDMGVTYAHIHVSDVAEAMIASVAREDVSGALALSDGTPMAWREFFRHLRTFLPSVRVIDLPAGPIQWLLELVEPIRLHRKPTMATPDTVKSWRMRQAIDPDKGWTALGIEPAYPSVETGIPATLEETLPESWHPSLSDRRR